MTSLRLIPLPEMRLRPVQLLILLALTALTLAGVGCATTEPDNASVRPWNAPQGWEGNALGGMDSLQRR